MCSNLCRVDLASDFYRIWPYFSRVSARWASRASEEKYLCNLTVYHQFPHATNIPELLQLNMQSASKFRDECIVIVFPVHLSHERSKLFPYCPTDYLVSYWSWPDLLSTCLVVMAIQNVPRTTSPRSPILHLPCAVKPTIGRFTWALVVPLLPNVILIRDTLGKLPNTYRLT